DVLRRNRIRNGQRDDGGIVGLDRKLRNKRGTEAGANECEERPAVDFAERGMPVARRGLRQPSVRRAHHRQVAELVERDRTASRRDLRPRRNDEQESLRENRVDLEAALDRGSRREGSVQRAALDEVDELLGRAALEELDALLRVALAEPLQRGGEQRRRDRTQGGGTGAGAAAGRRRGGLS